MQSIAEYSIDLEKTRKIRDFEATNLKDMDLRQIARWRERRKKEEGACK